MHKPAEYCPERDGKYENYDFATIKEFDSGVEAQRYYIDHCNPERTCVAMDSETKRYTIIPALSPVNSRVRNVVFLGYSDDYVYDIETTDGTFHAGVGSLIVKNTDSIYTQFTVPDQEKLSEEETLKRIFAVSSECANRISSTFKHPIELEMEKVMWPCLMLSKKRYVTIMYEQIRDEILNTGMDIKGFQMVRRDSCKLVKRVGNLVLDKIMVQKDIEGAKRVAKEEVCKLLREEVDIEELVISKSLKNEYKDTNINGQPLQKPAHWDLVQRIKTRAPGTEPKPGSRVPFVFIKTDDAKASQSDRIESPDYVLANPGKCKIDVVHYLEKQVATPLFTLFAVLLTDKRTDKLFEPKRKVMRDKHGRESVKMIVSRECENMIASELWENQLIRKRNTNNKQSMISDFFASYK